MSATKQNIQEGGTVRWLKSFFTSTNKNTDQSQVSDEKERLKKMSQAPRKNKTVLVLDDDPVFLKAASMRLDAAGYDVLTAKEGAEAIQIARKNKPDALVLDVNLTRDVAGVPWDGFSVMTWIKRFDALKEVPVVIASDSEPAKLADKVADSGAAAFFQKKMNPQQLVAFVNQGIALPPRATATATTATGNFQI